MRRTPFHDAIQLTPVVAGDVLHVAEVLVAALDLEAADAGVDQRLQVVRLVVVLHRQQVLLEGDDAALIVRERVGQAAVLRAVAAVGAALGVRVADVALAGKGHAQRAVDEELERHVVGQRRGADGRDLPEAQLARQHHLRKADLAEELRLLHRADVALRRGMQLDRRQVELQQTHVLHDQRVGTGVVHLPGDAPRFLQFVVVQDGVQRHQHAGVVTVGMFGEGRDLRDVVAGVGARAEGRAADIDGVGTMVDGLDAELAGLGRGEQLEFLRGFVVHGARGQGKPAFYRARSPESRTSYAKIATPPLA